MEWEIEKGKPVPKKTAVVIGWVRLLKPKRVLSRMYFQSNTEYIHITTASCYDVVVTARVGKKVFIRTYIHTH